MTSKLTRREMLERVAAGAASLGERHTRNSSDRIYNGLSSAEKTGLTLRTVPADEGFSGLINLRVPVG